MNILTAENITLSFGTKEVLKGVTIRAEQGKITGLLGRNGCGKSTLLRVVFGTQPATDKNIHVNGKFMKYPYTHKGCVNYMPQFSFFPKGLKIKEALSDFGVAPERVLADFPALEQDMQKAFAELSGGTERLWTVLILLFARTQFTLLDEPFTHIMPLHIDKLKEILQREKHNKGIIMTDHMYRHLVEISDSIYLIKETGSLLVRDSGDLVLHGYINAL